MTNAPHLALRAQVVQNNWSVADMELIRIKVSRFWNEFGSNDSNTFKLWTRTTQGNHTSASWGSWQEAEFFIEAKGTRSPQSYPQLSWAEFKTSVERLGLNPNLSATELMGQVQFLVRLPRGVDDKILTLQIYSGEGNQLERATLLIPPFILDPNQFRQSRPSVLFEFHPFKDRVGQNVQSADLMSAQEQFCF
jgi:hypothetical protein